MDKIQMVKIGKFKSRMIIVLKQPNITQRNSCIYKRSHSCKNVYQNNKKVKSLKTLNKNVVRKIIPTNWKKNY